MAGNVIITNANGNKVTLQNPDTNLSDIVVDTSAIVNSIGNQTIAGTKTFSSTISGSISRNSATATKLATARTINGVAFDGTANITVVDSTKAPLDSPALIGTPTAPTAAVGTNNTQIATTAFVLANTTQDAQFTSSLAASGYQKLPSGLIIQWGPLTGNSSVWQVVTYPIAFPNNVFTITTPGVKNHTVNYAGAGANTPITIANTSTPKTGFRWAVNGGSTDWGGYYIAIGY